MPRTILSLLAAACLLTSACSRREAAPETTAEPAAPAPIEPAAPAKSAPAATLTPPTTAPAPSATTRLRDLAANYLASDGHGGWHKNETAATELEKLSADETAQLWLLLKDQDANIRRGAAVFLLPQFDEANSQQIEAFAALLGDSDSVVRARGLDAARQFLGSDKIAALPQVMALLSPQREDRVENRAAAARLCGGMKKDATSAVAALQAAAADPDAKVRSAALVALTQVTEPTFYLPPLSTALTDSDPSVRLVAAARLRQVGPAAAPTAHVLAEALADSNKDVAEAAAEALIRIGKPAIEPLANQLTGSSTPARKLALACLAKLGPAAKPAAARIEKCKQDSDAEVRKLAEIAIKNLGSP